MTKPTKLHLVPGVIDAEGRVAPIPTLVTLGADGSVIDHRPLTGHETPFTTPLDALLHLPTLTLRPL